MPPAGSNAGLERPPGRQRQLNVWVTADEPLVCEAVCALLDKEVWLAPTGARSLADAAKQLDRAEQPAALVVIVRVATQKLLDAIARLRDRVPGVGLCLVAERVDSAALRRVVGDAAGSFALLKRTATATRRDLLVALQALVSGRVLLPPGDLETLVAGADVREDAWDSLSPAESSVAELVSDGLRNRDIAVRVGRSEKAIQHMVGRLYTKFGLDGDRERRVLLAQLAVAHRNGGDGAAAD